MDVQEERWQDRCQAGWGVGEVVEDPLLRWGGRVEQEGPNGVG
jgi:hypothetical protein